MKKLFKCLLSLLIVASLLLSTITVSLAGNGASIVVTEEEVDDGVYKLVFTLKTPDGTAPEMIKSTNLTFSFDNTKVQPVHNSKFTAVDLATASAKNQKAVFVAYEGDDYALELAPVTVLVKGTRTGVNVSTYTTDETEIDTASGMAFTEFYFTYIGEPDADTFKVETDRSDDSFLGQFYNSAAQRNSIVVGNYIYGAANGNDTVDNFSITYTNSAPSNDGDDGDDDGDDVVIPDDATAIVVTEKVVDEDEGVNKLVFKFKAPEGTTPERISSTNLVFSFDNTKVQPVNKSKFTAVDLISATSASKKTVFACYEDADYEFSIAPVNALVSGTRTGVNVSTYYADTDIRIDVASGMVFTEFYFKYIGTPDADTFKVETDRSSNSFLSQFYNSIYERNSIVINGEYSYIYGSADDDDTIDYFSMTYTNSSAVTIVASGECGDSAHWTLDENGLLTIFGTGDMSDYSSSSSGITTAPWSSLTDSIKNVIIENGITSIGARAFSGCRNLANITISDSVTAIKSYPFSRCSGLTNITIPASVTSITFNTFNSCDNLLNINVDKNNSNYTSVDGVLFNKNKTSIIQYPVGKPAQSYTIPDSVTTVGDSSFSSCYNLKSITIPDSVTTIDGWSFTNCKNLTSIALGNGVTEIRSSAFMGCGNLTSITIPGSVTKIWRNAFGNCTKLTDVYYNGTKADWEAVSVDSDNDTLLNATFHFTKSPPAEGASITVNEEVVDADEDIRKLVFTLKTPDGTYPENIQSTNVVFSFDNTKVQPVHNSKFTAVDLATASVKNKKAVFTAYEDDDYIFDLAPVTVLVKGTRTGVNVSTYTTDDTEIDTASGMAFTEFYFTYIGEPDADTFKIETDRSDDSFLGQFYNSAAQRNSIVVGNYIYGAANGNDTVDYLKMPYTDSDDDDGDDVVDPEPPLDGVGIIVTEEVVDADKDIRKLVFTLKTPEGTATEMIKSTNLVFSFDNTKVQPVHNSKHTAVDLVTASAINKRNVFVAYEDDDYAFELAPVIALVKDTRTGVNVSTYYADTDIRIDVASGMPFTEFYFTYIGEPDADTFKVETDRSDDSFLGQFYNSAAQRNSIVVGNYIYGAANGNDTVDYLKMPYTDSDDDDGDDVVDPDPPLDGVGIIVTEEVVDADKDIRKLVFTLKAPDGTAPEMIKSTNLVFSFDNTKVQPVHNSKHTAVDLVTASAINKRNVFVAYEDDDYAFELAPVIALVKDTRTGVTVSTYYADTDIRIDVASGMAFTEFYFKYIGTPDADTFKIETDRSDDSFLGQFYNSAAQRNSIVVGNYIYGAANGNDTVDYLKMPYEPTPIPPVPTVTLKEITLTPAQTTVVAPALGAEAVTIEIEAKAIDTNDEEMELPEDATWSLKSAPNGVALIGNVLKVAPCAQEGTATVAIATGDKEFTTEIAITRAASVPTTLTLTADGEDVESYAITIPITAASPANTVAFAATAKDQYGVEITDGITIAASELAGTTFADNTLTVNYGAENGTITVTATLGELTDVITVTVSTIDIVVDWTTVTVADITYGQTVEDAITLPATGTATVGDATYNGTFSVVNGNDTLNAGAAIATVAFTIADGELNGVVMKKDFAFNVAKADQTIVAEDKTFVYDGTAKSINATAETELTYSENAFVDAGEYTVTITAAETNNYNAATKTVTLTITKATSVITATDVQTFTYDGSAKSVSAALNHNETALTYSQNGFVNAGEYTVTITAAETTNYKPATKTVKLIINKAVATGFATEAPTLTYTAKEAFEAGITSVETLKEAFGLPATVIANFGTIGSRVIAITWADAPQAWNVKGGTYTFECITTGKNITFGDVSLIATATVTPVTAIAPALSNVTINKSDLEAAVTYADLRLPEVITLDVDGEDIAIEPIWSLTVEDLKAIPTDGSVTLNVTNLPVWATVTGSASLTFKVVKTPLVGTITLDHADDTMSYTSTLPGSLGTDYTLAWYIGEEVVGTDVTYNVTPADYNKTIVLKATAIGNTYQGEVTSEEFVIPVKQHTYKFVDEDGTVLKETTADYGTVIEAPVAPEKPATAKYTYTFDKWDGFTEGAILTADVTFTAVYSETINQYTYKFVDEDGTVLKEITADYGTVIEAPVAPEKPATAKYTYTFDKWDGFTEGAILTADATFTAVYSATINKYTYKFVDEDGTVLKETTADYGTVIEAPVAPEKPATAKYTYTFDKWYGFTEGAILTADVTFTAIYSETINKYTYKFVDENGTVLEEITADYGTVIKAPVAPEKPATAKYTYTFDKWDGFTEGAILTADATFTAVYSETINQYTYKFLDVDKSAVLYERTVDYGTVITPPDAPKDRDPYTFDYWQGYEDGLTITEDIEFTAVYRYKSYVITAEGIVNQIMVAYNSNYVIEPQIKDGYTFEGYFTEKDGKGDRITDETGASVSNYTYTHDLTVYPYFKSLLINQIKIQGDTSALPNETLTQQVVFATDKDVTYLTLTVKYPKFLDVKNINKVDFVDVAENGRRTVAGFNYIDIVCTHNFADESMPTGKNLIPFEIEFTVAKNATIGDAQITLENIELTGETSYYITDITNTDITIHPKRAEKIEIVGSSEIDKSTKYEAIFTPDYTTNKNVVWSVDNSKVATISEDGTLTPVKNGVVTLKASTLDGSNVFATKTINVTAYAKITTLTIDKGINALKFDPDVRQYKVYVTEDTETITLTPTFTGGILIPNGTGRILTGKSKEFTLSDGTTTITLSRQNVPETTDSVYTIEVIKVKNANEVINAQKADVEISSDGKVFTVSPDENIGVDLSVILALYNNGRLVEWQKLPYEGSALTFTTTENYTNAKVMVWDWTKLQPVGDVVIVK